MGLGKKTIKLVTSVLQDEKKRKLYSEEEIATWKENYCCLDSKENGVSFNVKNNKALVIELCLL